MTARADRGAAPHRARSRGDLAVLGFALAVLVGLVQVALPTRDVGPAVLATVPYAAGLAVVLVLHRRRRSGHDVFGPVVVAMAVLGVGLAAWVLVRFGAALPGVVGEPFGFYRLKGRLTTPLGDHNTAAGLLLPTLVASSLLAVRDRRWGLAAGVVALGLAATLSRGAAVVLAVVVALAYPVASRRRIAVTLTFAFAVVVAVLVLASTLLDTAVPAGTAPPGPASRSALADVVGASVTGRIDLAVRGIEVGAAHPLLGAGLGTFGDAVADLPEPNDHAHQQFAHAFAVGGLPLLAATLLVVGVLVVRGARALRRPATRQRDLVLLGGAGLVLHAQIDMLSGLLGFEVLLAALTGVAAAVVAGAPDSLPASADLSPPA